MKYKKQKKFNKFMTDFAKKVFADRDAMERVIRAEYRPVLEKAEKCAKLGLFLQKQLESKEQQLRLCEIALKESNARADREKIEADAWQNVAQLNFKNAERLGHYKWMFWAIFALNIIQLIVNLICHIWFASKGV